MQVQDGRITRFLNRCLRLEQCWFDEDRHRYVFDLYSEMCVQEETIFVYPKERRIWFRSTREIFLGETPDPCGVGFSDSYDTIVVESVDKKDLSSEEAAKMLCELFTKHDLDHVVSKRSLRLLR